MTTPPNGPTRDDDDTSATGSPRPEEASGVELGMSEKAGGTFEPEEDAEPDS